MARPRAADLRHRERLNFDRTQSEHVEPKEPSRSRAQPRDEVRRGSRRSHPKRARRRLHGAPRVGEPRRDSSPKRRSKEARELEAHPAIQVCDPASEGHGQKPRRSAPASASNEKRDRRTGGRNRFHRSVASGRDHGGGPSWSAQNRSPRATHPAQACALERQDSKARSPALDDVPGCIEGEIDERMEMVEERADDGIARRARNVFFLACSGRYVGTLGVHGDGRSMRRAHDSPVRDPLGKW